MGDNGKYQTAETPKVETARAALLAFMLMKESAQRQSKTIGTYEDMDGFRRRIGAARGALFGMRTLLKGVVDKLETDWANASYAEKLTRGTGALADIEEDEEDVQTSMSAVLGSRARATPQTLELLTLVQRCCDILGSEEDGRKERTISIYDADFLARTMKELADNAQLICTAATDGGRIGSYDLVQAVQRDAKSMEDVARGLGKSIEKEPYVILRSIVSDMFGPGAVREFDGIGDESKYASFDLSTVEGLCALASTIGNVSAETFDAGILDWTPAQAQALREALADVCKGIGSGGVFESRESAAEESIELLDRYAGIQAKDAKRCMEGVLQAERIFRTTSEAIVRRKSKGKGPMDPILPVMGIGHILNPLRYSTLESPDGAYSDVIGLLRSAYETYRGWQDIQNRLLESTRILCGSANRRESSNMTRYGGETWFPERMACVSTNRVRTDPKYNVIVQGRLEELVKTIFAIENENVKLGAIPTELLVKEDPIVDDVERRMEQERTVSSELMEVAREYAGRDLAAETAAALDKAEIDPRNFHALVGVNEKGETPAGIAASQLLGFCKELHRESARRGGVDARLLERLKQALNAKGSDGYVTVLVRICEMCGISIEPRYPLVKDFKGETVVLDRKDASSAYKWLADELERVKGPSDETLGTMLGLFAGYAPWDARYGAEVRRQVEARREYEVARAVKWQGVFREALKQVGRDSEYQTAVMRSSRIANVVVSSLLVDCVLKGAGYREKGRIPDGGVEVISRRLWWKSEKRTVPVSPEEDLATELILEPLAREAFESACSRLDGNLTKDAWERSEKGEAKKGASMFVKCGALMSFDESIVLNGLSEMKRYGDLKRGASASGNAVVEEYAQAKLSSLVCDRLVHPFTDDQWNVSKEESTMSAATQKEKAEAVLEAVEKGDVGKAFEALGAMERNNPVFLLHGAGEKAMTIEDLRNAVVYGHADIKEILMEARWADRVSQFSERMGGTPDETKLAMSDRWLKERKEDACKAVGKGARLMGIGSDRTVEIASRVVPAISMVFSPETGFLVGRDVADGEQAFEIGLAAIQAKEVLGRQLRDDLRNDLLASVGRYAQSIEGVGEYRVGYGGRTFGKLFLSTRTDLYDADSGRRNSGDEDRLYSVQGGRARGMQGRWGSMLKDASVPFVSKVPSSFWAKEQEEFFSSKDASKEPREATEKWMASQSRGDLAYERTERFRRKLDKAEMVLGC